MASSGIIALVTVALFYGITAVLARYLATGSGVFEQWYLRYGIAFISALIIFHGRLDFGKFRRLPKAEWQILIFRSLVGGVAAVGLYTLAAQNAKIGAVAFMQAVPTLSALGILLMHEKLTAPKAGLIALSFVGVIIAAVENPHDLMSLNIGEIYSLISGALFSLFFITRKWHTGALNNQEITLATLGLSAVANYLLSLVLYHRLFPDTSGWSPFFVVVLLVAGIMGVANIFLLNFGFERVSGIIAGNIMNLEQLFGPIFGFIFYGEVLTGRELIGGIIIVAAAIGMNRLGNGHEPAAGVPD